MREMLGFLDCRQEPGPATFLRTHRINSSFATSGRSAEAPPGLTEPWREWLPEQQEVFFEEAGQTMIDCGFATEAESLADTTSRSASNNGGSASAPADREPGLVPRSGGD